MLPQASYFTAPDFTIMVWVKFLSFRSYTRIFYFSDSDSLKFLVLQSHANTGRLEFYRPDYWFRTEDDILSIGDWIHIAVTKLGNTIKLFIDSNEIMSQQISETPSYQSMCAEVKIGGKPDNTGHQIMDELKIFNIALSIDQITAEKNKVQPFDIEEIIY